MEYYKTLNIVKIMNIKSNTGQMQHNIGIKKLDLWWEESAVFLHIALQP